MAGLHLDTFSQHIFGYKYKTASNPKMTMDSLEKTFQALHLGKPSCPTEANISTTRRCVSYVENGE